MERKEITSRIESIGGDMDDMDFDAAIAFLQDRKKQYDERLKQADKVYHRYKLSWEQDPYEDSETYRLYVVGVRYENDQEFSQRQKDEAERKERNGKWQRAEYERLKKQFEGIDEFEGK